jgi:Ca2+-binding EF-hand superfamily protein
MEYVRMKALFHLFNLDASDLVSFQEVVTGVHKITEDLDNAVITAVGALLICDEDGNQVFDYAEFTKFILQLTAITNNQTRYPYR